MLFPASGPAVAVLAPGLVRCPLDGRVMRGSFAAVVVAAGLLAPAASPGIPGEGITPAAPRAP